VNFLAKCGPWLPCQRAWHGRCYCATDNGEFLVAKFMIVDAKEEKRFMVARDAGMGTTWLCPSARWQAL